MHAARLHEYGPPLGIDEVPAPTPGAGQVVIRVKGAGFCHRELHVISGKIRSCPACRSRSATRTPVNRRMKHGEVAGRAVITPQIQS